VLVITIVLMTIGTTGTGLLPGYSAIGIWAPIVLIVARVFQGLSTGGEYVGAMTMRGNTGAPSPSNGNPCCPAPATSWCRRTC
jgi:MFS family permease